MAPRWNSKRAEALRRRFEEHWHSLLYLQIAAYAIVMLLWALPLPNPVKVLAVTFHELSHGMAALLTGGRVFGFAIAPSGAGVTFGVGGYFPAILVAGYAGSCLAGAAIYAASVKYRPQTCIVFLEFFMVATALLGWLNSYTMLFALTSMALMAFALWLPEWVQLLFLRLAGSACCLYAPLEVLSDALGAGGPPSVMGYRTESDLAQLAELSGIPALSIGVLIMTVQAALVVYLIRWSCRAGAKAQLRREAAYLKRRRKRLKEVRQPKKVYSVR